MFLAFDSLWWIFPVIDGMNNILKTVHHTINNLLLHSIEVISCEALIKTPAKHVSLVNPGKLVCQLVGDDELVHQGLRLVVHEPGHVPHHGVPDGAGVW